tara:strand:- start:118 stop:477 length:360 start_codon:yes stop_codon:yes gene_type:complete
MTKIMLKFESELSTESLESLFDTVATVLSEDLYSEQNVIGTDGVESNYNLIHHETHGYHCYDMPISRPLSIEESKALYQVLDNAITGDYMLEISADSTELQNRYKFNSFEGAIQEGDLD